MIPERELKQNRINPAYFSEEECEFLMAHAGEPVVVAMRSATNGVNRNAVEPLLKRIVELEDLARHEAEAWIGIDAFRSGLKLYLDVFRKWSSDRRRGAPRWPSMFGYTAKGRPIAAAPGADNKVVQTYFDASGERKSFVMDLVPDAIPQWHPEWSKADEPKVGLKINNDLHRVECFCGHTEQFNEESRASYNTARARMSKHLRAATTDVDQHREVYSLEYAS